MNLPVVQNAIGEFQRLLGKAQDALTQIEAERYGYPENVKPIGYADPEVALSISLNHLKERLMVLLEAADLRDTRASLDTAWQAFKAKPNGLSAVFNDDEYQYTYSPALTYLQGIVETLQTCVDRGLSSVEAAELGRLEWILQRTAVLVHQREESISREMDLQKFMHDYLSAAFPDFVKNVRIPGGLKNFDPDCGIRGLGAAVEFKLVHTKDEVGRAISGVIEDIGGYRGSKDWTRFYSVFYQEHPFMTEAQVRKELHRAGGKDSWTPFVVNGVTKQRPMRKIRAKKSIASRNRP